MLHQYRIHLGAGGLVINAVGRSQGTPVDVSVAEGYVGCEPLSNFRGGRRPSRAPTPHSARDVIWACARPGQMGCAVFVTGPCWTSWRQALQVVDLSDTKEPQIVLRTRGSGVRISPGAPHFQWSIPGTWFTDYSGDMGNTLAPNGFGAHSTRHSWSSKKPKPRAESDNVNVEVSLADLARDGAPED